MAISKIRPLHGRNGVSFTKTLKDREDYGVNPDKTDQGRLITAYQCNPHYAYKEFYATKQLYEMLTGRSREHRTDVIAYLVIQSYKQGEITPEAVCYKRCFLRTSNTPNAAGFIRGKMNDCELKGGDSGQAQSKRR